MNSTETQTQTHTQTQTQTQTATKSPSVSSISSIETNNSTEHLIASLSSTQVNSQISESSKIPQSEAIKADILNNSLLDAKARQESKTPKKKAIKFTVRKVSHEPINASTATSPHISHSHSHKDKVVSGEHEDIRKLQSIQSKYDQYDARIIKIDKEIEFLIQLLPPYNVEIDYGTRVKINKAIEKLRMKKDEIEKKKYTLGITISRLWRSCEGSEIWVRKFDNW
ncbi:hypothetical protein KGF56_004301 [Candida oxycetoniae]|uniref:Uncharacterized protein n=1 Tax=Candida oxycetoniae TaxID=497107 RepID=A0AAI9STN8_9ASCO|nr:uncharacterized protein KGF56_004301 [Candida oxycetoniae]KAI3402840.2 hypothetical protein KGF56_004301 [Candida oxycetoniae]